MGMSESKRINKQMNENRHTRSVLFRLAGVDEDLIRMSGAKISNEKLRDLAFSRRFGFLTDKHMKFKFSLIKIGEYFKDFRIVRIWSHLKGIPDVAATANTAYQLAQRATDKSISLRFPPDELVTAIAERLSIHDSQIVSTGWLEKSRKESLARREKAQERWDEHDGVTGDEEHTTNLRETPEYWKEEGHGNRSGFVGLGDKGEPNEDDTTTVSREGRSILPRSQPAADLVVDGDLKKRIQGFDSNFPPYETTFGGIKDVDKED